MVALDGPHPLFERVTITTRPKQSVLPGRARSIGIWRSLTDNTGRSAEALNCGIGDASERGDGTGRAFQARVKRLIGTLWIADDPTL